MNVGKEVCTEGLEVIAKYSGVVNADSKACVKINGMISEQVSSEQRLRFMFSPCLMHLWINV